MMRSLIASNKEEITRDVHDCLVRQGIDCRDEDVVAFDRILDRASRTMPELLVIVLPLDMSAGLEALRETASTLPNGSLLFTAISNPQLAMIT